jgi:hypothetical protein
MDRKLIGYWISTGLFAFALGAAGVSDVLLTADMVAAMEALGYPLYFAQILGTWKVLGVLALVAPGLPKLKEWAYAGFFFNLTGAALSHLAVGHGVAGAAAPLILLAIAGASYALRPAARVYHFDAPASSLGEPMFAK